jgi:hypothetical protein
MPPTYVSSLLASFLLFGHKNDLFVVSRFFISLSFRWADSTSFWRSSCGHRSVGIAQFSGKFICPSMTGPDNNARGDSSAYKLIRAVLANIVENAYFCIAAAYGKQAFARNFKRNVGTNF